jgi:hypothetical protein
VAIWRELRKGGAVALQQATWALPARREFRDVVERAVALVERGGGESLVFEAAPTNEDTRGKLEAMFTGAREEEWSEFLSECSKYLAEIERENRTKKFTSAELDEEEQSLSRLQRWYRELRMRDVFHAPSQQDAGRHLKECAEALEDFAERVFQAGGER